jgi:isopentenyl phosphate kinase
MRWILYHTLPNINYLLDVAGIYVMNNDKAREYRLQLRAKADDSIIGSAEHVLGGVEDIMD